MTNWPIKKLGAIAGLLNGYAFKSSDYIKQSNTLNFRMSNIRPDGTVDINYNPKYLPDTYTEKYRPFLLKDGDIVIAMTDMANDPKILGVPTIVRTDGKNLLLNQRVGKFVDLNTDEIYIPFLRYYLSTKTVKNYYKFLGGGGLQINISKQNILSVTIPVPPIEEQRRIVKKLEKILAKIEEGKKLREETQSSTQNILYTELGKIFKDGEKKGWKKGGFKDLVDTSDKNTIKPGPFGSSLKKNIYVKSGYKIYGQEQVISGDANYGDYYIDEKKYKELIAFKVSAGDVLISLVGTIGKVLIVPDNFEQGVINPRLLKITPNRLKVDSNFITYLLKSPLILNQISQRSHGGTMNILNKGILESLDILIPPLIEQQRIISQLDGLSRKVQKLQTLQQEQLQDLEALQQSVLHQAFEGK